AARRARLHTPCGHLPARSCVPARRRIMDVPRRCNHSPRCLSPRAFTSTVHVRVHVHVRVPVLVLRIRTKPGNSGPARFCGRRLFAYEYAYAYVYDDHLWGVVPCGYAARYAALTSPAGCVARRELAGSGRHAAPGTALRTNAETTGEDEAHGTCEGGGAVSAIETAVHRHAIRSAVARRSPPARRLPRPPGRRRAARTDAAPKALAAQVFLRRPRLAVVRGHLRVARVLSHAHRACAAHRDCRRRDRGDPADAARRIRQRCVAQNASAARRFDERRAGSYLHADRRPREDASGARH